MTNYQNYLVSLIKQPKMGFTTAKCKVIMAGSQKANLMVCGLWIKRDKRMEILCYRI